MNFLTYSQFLNESYIPNMPHLKEGNALHEVTVTKKDVINVLKNKLDFGFVKASKNRYVTKTLVRKYAVKGGGVGPMTATNAYEKHNKEAIRRVLTALQEEYDKVDYDITNDFANFQIGKLKLTFVLSMFKTHVGRDLDPAYQTFWWVLSS